VVDTCVLLDVLEDDAAFGARSAERIRDALNDYALVAPPFVFCELLAGGHSDAAVASLFMRSRIGYDEAVPTAVYKTAAARFRDYLARRRASPDEVVCPGCGSTEHPACSECGRPLAQRKMAMDFLIGAYALRAADGAILTRDSGVFAPYFPDVRLV
jgi:hypothetical protein